MYTSIKKKFKKSIINMYQLSRGLRNISNERLICEKTTAGIILSGPNWMFIIFDVKSLVAVLPRRPYKLRRWCSSSASSPDKGQQRFKMNTFLNTYKCYWNHVSYKIKSDINIQNVSCISFCSQLWNMKITVWKFWFTFNLHLSEKKHGALCSVLKFYFLNHV